MRSLTAISSAAVAALVLAFASPVAAQGAVTTQLISSESTLGTAPASRLISVESTLRTVPVASLRHPSSGASVEAAEAVGRIYADAVFANNWRQAAILIHPDALAELKAAVREESKGGTTEWPVSLMAGVRSIEDFDRMSPATVFVRLMRLVDAREPDLTAGIVDLRVQGATIESPTEARVAVEVTRRDSWGKTRTHRDEIRLELLNDAWRVQPTGQVKKMMQIAKR